jgi:uncharacterized RDD family membrane protein YckC
MFKKRIGSELLPPLEPPISRVDTEEEKIGQEKRPPDVSETVASIKASLEEIEAGEPESTESPPEERSSKIESDVIQMQKGGASDEENRNFPAFNEIDWGKSVSLSGDELKLDIDGLAGEEEEKAGEIRYQDEKSYMSDTKTEKLKEELEQVGEELRQIEEVPKESEPVYPPELPDMSFEPSTVRKGGFWIRFIAYTIDNIILNILGFILMNIGLIAFGLGSSEWGELEVGKILSIIIPYLIFMIIINIAYYTYFHGSTGQTLGKMICKLKVIQVNGKPLGYGKAFLRWAGYIISSFIFYLGFLWAVWDKDKQAWHDKIAGTYVIRT